ncbi:MAG: fatty acid desaturase family protein [Pirellulaceae bacterium]
MSSQTEYEPISLREAQNLVRDLTKPNPTVYWADFLISILTGHALFHLVLYADRWMDSAQWWFWPVRVALFFATALLYHRSVMFTHELVHLPRGEFRGFRIAWNLLCGIPFLIPSYMYYPHVDHHRRKSYGTDEDGEYLNLSHRSPWLIVGYLLSVLVVPLLGFFRFAVITPLWWIFPAMRGWTWHHASTMVMDPTYFRPDAGERVHRIRLLQEVGCFVFCMFLALRGPLIQGVAFDPLWVQAYLMGVTILTLNNVRTLGAHRWTGDGEPLSFEEQLLDSVNYPERPWITELWGPVGTRYHAIHHLLPSLPYHNLGPAHRRLMEGLPANSIYRLTNRTSLLGEIATLWRRSANRHRKSIDHRNGSGNDQLSAA